MIEAAYKIVPHISGANDCYEYALLDPNGLVVSRSAHQGAELRTLQRKLQEAFDLGREWERQQLEESINRWDNVSLNLSRGI